MVKYYIFHKPHQNNCNTAKSVLRIDKTKVLKTAGSLMQVESIAECSLGLNKCATLKPVLSGHSKIDKNKVLKTNNSLMEVESIAECSRGLNNCGTLKPVLSGHSKIDKRKV